MQKLIFLFTNGEKFNLNLPAKLNRKSFAIQLADFQAFCLVGLSDHKKYASGKTSFKIATHRPSWIGLLTEEGKVLPILDETGKVAKIKGHSILVKVGKGKDAQYNANPDLSRFLWSKIATILGAEQTCSRVSIAVPVLDAELTEARELAEANKVKRLASGQEPKEKVSHRVIVNA
jgi:hypothetical protein